MIDTSDIFQFPISSDIQTFEDTDCLCREKGIEIEGGAYNPMIL